MKKGLVVLAAAAHPDDVEFGMAGTLALLKRRGAQIHIWNLADGSCGSSELPGPKAAALRWNEARASAGLMGAKLHPPIGRDLQLFFEPRLLARAAARIREIKPAILLLPSPEDYMEDHQNACRLAATAAFVRGMRNFKSRPARAPWSGSVALYHAQPHMNRDALNRPLRPSLYVNVGEVWALKKAMLACHQSQASWLDKSQALSSPLRAQEEAGLELGRWSRRFRLAEGWRRHGSLGYSAPDFDPLLKLLKGYIRES